MSAGCLHEPMDWDRLNEALKMAQAPLLEGWQRMIGECSELRAERDVLASIVRVLASDDNPWIEGDIFQGAGCRYCDGPKPEHEDGCEWVSAREWTQSQETP